MRSQITSHTSNKVHICKKCFTHFTKKYLFKKHSKYCSKNETVTVKMPTKNSILKFQNHFKKLPIPFTIYADFECFTMPIHSCQPNPIENKKRIKNPIPKVIRNMNQVVTVFILKVWMEWKSILNH